MTVIQVFNEDDCTALVLRIFQRYLLLVRKLQSTYVLEPAGSHGVWSLDDYQFLPFYFGAAQLLDHPRILPKSVLSNDVRENFAHDYLYLQAIEFIGKMKTGPFGEHSPILHSMAHVEHQLWWKLNN